MNNKTGLFILIILFFPVANADVISINSGGSQNIVINPDTHIEGFFSCIPYTCSGLGYECGTWSDGCGGVLNCGTCSSGYNCVSGVCVATGGPGGGGGGGGGGGEGAPAPSCNIVVSPSEINIDLRIRTNKPQIIRVTNNGKAKINITPVQVNFADGVNLIFNPSSFFLEPGETKELEVTFVALNKPGIFTGTIKIGCKEVLSTANVKTLQLLFDSNIIVLNKNYQVEQGDKLKTKVSLLPLGDKERMDVTLNYVIKDYSGKVYLTQSETLLIKDKKDFKKNFDTGGLAIGKYIVGLELVYPGGVAPSSAHFEVIKKPPVSFFGKIILYLVILILLVAIFIVILLIKRYAEKRKQQETFQE